MGYAGQIATLVFGDGGLKTDDPQNKLLPTDLITAKNIDFTNGLVEKDPGSVRFNQSPLPSGVVAGFDWWPDDVTQRMIAVTRAGNVYKYKSGFLPAISITPGSGAPANLVAGNQTLLVAGGNEVTGNPRKLFIFSGAAPQVIYGDAEVRNNLTKPALDWTGSNQPNFGIIHRSRMVAFGNRNFPHSVYFSSGTDNEDFQTAASFVTSCNPGEAEKLIGAMVYKGKLFVIKYPYGVYQLVDDDPLATNWYFVKIQDELGAISQHSVAPIINDVLVANANGMISSLSAVLDFGNLRSGEILYILRAEGLVRDNFNPQGLQDRHMIYYSDKKQLLATYRSTGNIYSNNILKIDFLNPQRPKVAYSDKDQANFLAQRKDDFGVKRPFYGSEDGYIYLMDRKDRSVAGTGYELDFQTPHLDFSHIDVRLGDVNKLYEFLEVDYEPTGDFDLTVEVYIDGLLAKTMTFNMNGFSNLDSFILDQYKLDPETLKQRRLPLNVSGRRISIRGLNSNSGENCKIARMHVYYRISGQNQKGDT